MAKVISVKYDLSTESELDAFFGAFFKFVETEALNDADSISIRADNMGNPLVRVITFGDEAVADQFSTYWTQRRKWLGL